MTGPLTKTSGDGQQTTFPLFDLLSRFPRLSAVLSAIGQTKAGRELLNHRSVGPALSDPGSLAKRFLAMLATADSLGLIPLRTAALGSLMLSTLTIPIVGGSRQRVADSWHARWIACCFADVDEAADTLAFLHRAAGRQLVVVMLDRMIAALGCATPDPDRTRIYLDHLQDMPVGALIDMTEKIVTTHKWTKLPPLAELLPAADAMQNWLRRMDLVVTNHRLSKEGVPTG